MKSAHASRGHIAGNVRAELARRSISQQQLADWLGIQQPAVSQKLNAKRPFDTDELGVIAERLEVPMSVLTAEPVYALPFPSRMKEAGRPEGRPAVVAGAGFEPATSGLRAQPDYITLGLAEAEKWANARAEVTS